MFSEKNYRIFLSYRGNTEGKQFESDLYNYFKEDPFWKERYGGIYFSPDSDPTGNFKTDINPIMNSVEFFIMPLTADYFDDFWDENNNSPNPDSVTYMEILAAIKNKVHFICIAFDGFEMDRVKLKRLFENDSDLIDGAKLLKYSSKNKEDIFMQICDITLKKDIIIGGVSKIIKDNTPNVHMSFKSDTENKKRYPFYQKLYDVNSITLLNFASSSFISGIDIARIYNESDSLKRWFSYNLAKGKITANIILTDPLSYAAKDAAQFKMFPVDRTIPADEIILYNMNKLFEFMNKNPNAKLNVYLTKIALPYGIMITNHKNPENNHMKIDLYSPVIEHDGKRPSFYLLENDKDTAALYEFFKDNVLNIKENYSYTFNGHPDVEWMKNRHTPIIHRGVIKNGLLPHTKRAFDACIEARLPMEVDLLCLNDGAGSIIVGREDQIVKYNNKEFTLSDCRISDIRKINKEVGENKILTLEEFLQLINGKIPVILEIKTKEKVLDKKINTYVERITKIVTSYLRKCSDIFIYNYGSDNNTYSHGVAIHSSNPYVLKRIKEINCMIPCGIISQDFSEIINDVGYDFVKLHSETKFLEIFDPDFISYNIDFLDNGIAQSIKEKKGIPVLGWTVKNEDDQLNAMDYNCDNIIIEGSKSFI